MTRALGSCQRSNAIVPSRQARENFLLLRREGTYFFSSLVVKACLNCLLCPGRDFFSVCSCQSMSENPLLSGRSPDGRGAVRLLQKKRPGRAAITATIRIGFYFKHVQVPEICNEPDCQKPAPLFIIFQIRPHQTKAGQCLILQAFSTHL